MIRKEGRNLERKKERRKFVKKKRKLFHTFIDN